MGVAMAPHAKDLIQVSDCNPALNVSQTGGWAGYSPGYYGPSRYYWGDVYGARYYQPPITTTNPEVAIHYTNISPKTMSSIEFGIIAAGVLKAEVRDVGTFTTGAEIKHKFGLSPNAFPMGSAIVHCVPFRITFADGTHWRNPNLPPKNQTLYHQP